MAGGEREWSPAYESSLGSKFGKIALHKEIKGINTSLSSLAKKCKGHQALLLYVGIQSTTVRYGMVVLNPEFFSEGSYPRSFP